MAISTPHAQSPSQSHLGSRADATADASASAPSGKIPRRLVAVSYTHLTLPTIYSV